MENPKKSSFDASPYEKEIQAVMNRILAESAQPVDPRKPLSQKIAEQQAFVYEYTATEGDKADKINSLHRQIHRELDRLN